MIITQAFTMARWQIVVKKAEATKQTKTKMTTKTNKQTKHVVFVTLLRTAAERAISEVTSCFAQARSPRP